MTKKSVPATLWYSTLGVGDGHDFATRGYLKALMEVGYKGLRLPPSLQTSVLRISGGNSGDLSAFSELLRPDPEARMKPLVTVKAGDPRIGTKRVIEGTDAHGNPSKVEVEITEGSIDLDVPQEFSNPTRSEVRCVVVHHDPVSICRQYASVAKGGRPQGVAYVGVTVWETSGIPQAIAMVLSELDRIVVPSDHSKTALEKSGVACPVDVVPHAFDEKNWPEPTHEELESYSSYGRYVFYSIATPIERKNLVGLLQAYFKAFEGSEEVVLRIKSSVDQGRFDEIIKKAEKQSGIKGRRPMVKLFGGQWPVDKIRAFHLDGHCYVSATRGEGFGLPEMEARLCGRPVITTGWGAAPEVLAASSTAETTPDKESDRNAGEPLLSFETPEDVDLVDYDLTPVFGMHGVGCYEPEQLWAEPKEEALISAMKHAFKRRPVCNPESWKDMQIRFGSDVIGRKLAGVLDRAQQEVDKEEQVRDGRQR